MYPEGSTRPPATSNVNYVAGQAVANRVDRASSTTGGSLGQITVYSVQSADVVVDVSGYFSRRAGPDPSSMPKLHQCASVTPDPRARRTCAPVNPSAKAEP